MEATTRARCPACGCWRAEGLMCCGCLYLARRARERQEGRRCKQCAQILSEAHSHSRCGTCHAARSAKEWEYRGRVAAQRFPTGIRRVLVSRVKAGESLVDVCQGLDITTQQAHGFKAYDSAWAEELDGALLAGRDPGLAHGRASAYRHGHCRCPECREYKISNDSGQQRRAASPARIPKRAV